MAGRYSGAAMAPAAVKVLVMAPHLGSDLGYVTGIDPRVEVLDGNRAFRAELVEQDRAPGPVPSGGPSRVERDRLLAEAEVLLVGFPVPPLLADRASSLRWAHHTQAGVSNLLRSDLWTSSVPLTSSRGAVGVTAIAEYVMGGVFHFARGLHAATRQERGGALSRDRYHMTAVAGATIGVVGLGGIGQEVARLARAVGMRVVGTRRSVTEVRTDIHGADLVLPASHLLELLAQSDFVVVCSQLTPETQGMIGHRAFAAMKTGSVLINIARGEEVDEQALLDAIKSGHLRGALLDVYDGELAGEPPRHALLDLPEILLTPHISASGDASGAERVKRLFADNLRRFINGEPLLNLVDRTRGY
jgi:phosphoglycerate dehydrogenase-like enzyme